MKLSYPLIVVRQMKRAREFYEKLLQQRVVLDFGENIVFDGGFSLQTEESWLDMIDMSQGDVRYRGNDAELYFETEDFDGFMETLKSNPEVRLVHDEMEHA